MASLVQVLGISMLMITVAQALSCLPDNERNCTPIEIVEQGCPLGVAKDVCDQCWICARGFKEICGGIWNMGGTCAPGLWCTNPYYGEIDINNQMPGICCRNIPITATTTRRPRMKCNRKCVVRNPCTQEYECKKKRGEVCGGPGQINGICKAHLVCYPPLSDATRFENSTCIRARRTSSIASTTISDFS